MNLWRDNRLDQEWSIADKEIARRYWSSEWSRYPWPFDRAFRLFLSSTEHDGLGSAFEEADYEGIAAHRSYRKTMRRQLRPSELLPGDRIEEPITIDVLRVDRHDRVLGQGGSIWAIYRQPDGKLEAHFYDDDVLLVDRYAAEA